MNAKRERMPQGITHVPPGDGRSLWVLGELVTYKTTGQQTGGAYSLFEVASQPGTGPPPHVQHREEEAFWVLQGKCEFLIEGRTLTASAGSLLYVPKCTLHTHKNVGEDVSRMLLTQTREACTKDSSRRQYGQEQTSRRRLLLPHQGRCRG